MRQSNLRVIGTVIALLSISVMLSVTSVTAQQQLRTPRLSPAASATQTIGVTEVTIKYSRPGVKGRTIWGGLVPYDTVWRTGANEATTISFADTVRIDGNTLPAGTYSLATIPGRDAWTIIFNKETDLWGAMGYSEANDALRVAVKPETAEENQEWMRFTFEDVKETSARVVLAWERLRVAFTIETPTHELVMRSARRAVSWSPASNAASYLLQRDVELDQAMKWIDLSLATEENYWNLRIKAQLLEKTGKKREAITTMERAIALGEKLDDAPFDFSQMKEKLVAWKK